MNEQLMQMMQNFSNAGAQGSFGGGQQEMLMQMMEKFKNKEQQDKAPSEKQQWQKTAKKQRHMIRSLQYQLQVAHSFIGHFADLIGACPQCLGQVDDCQGCRGRGGPGYRAPDPELIEWIGPSLALMERLENPSRPTSTPYVKPGENHER